MTIKSHEVEYAIIGEGTQLVEVILDPGETVIAEAGAMAYMEEGIAFEAKMGDGSDPETGFFGNLLGAGKRMLAGESLFMTHFTHNGSGKSRVAFAAPYPGKIIAADLAEMGGELICQQDAFLCAALGTKIDVAFTQSFGAGFFGGEGFVLQRLSGDGLAFIHVGGTVVEKQLNNETVRVDTGCIAAFTAGINYEIERAGSLKSMVFGGEGLFLATLSGTGTVYLQSMPFSKLVDKISAKLPPSKEEDD
jgi:uncharacterized protein (TIGR00266 family)|tara:strand:+ start:858 stop:1604 length:747 start_codon:yes stop_codon:yes gene_type:complete